MMKKFQKGLSAAVLLLLLCLAGCGVRETKQEGDRLQVVTTVFPYYDFTRQIAGEEVELTMVVPAGMDSHSFEPTPADMRLIQNADVLCNGALVVRGSGGHRHLGNDCSDHDGLCGYC